MPQRGGEEVLIDDDFNKPRARPPPNLGSRGPRPGGKSSNIHFILHQILSI